MATKRQSRYEIYPSGDGFRFRFIAPNGEIMFHGEEYVTVQNVKRAIKKIVVYAMQDTRVVILDSLDAKHHGPRGLVDTP